MIRVITLCGSLGVSVFASEISDYTVCARALTAPDGTRYQVTREYQKNGVPFALVVDLKSCQIFEKRRSDIEKWSPIPSDQASTDSFVLALNHFTSIPTPLQNAGLTHKDRLTPFLTMDLCPSTRGLDRDFLVWILTTTPQRPLPIGFSITGKWLETHERDFQWLLEQEHQGHFAITWINHSTTHPYDKSKPLTATFLLTEGTDFEYEVFTVEKMLLERGCVPSVFFRFPGLVSSDTLIEKLRDWSLIPIGSDAWIAKGQHPKPGSIVLMHANGNEPMGLRLFKELGPEKLNKLRWGPLTD